ncbi:MAG: MotA/TolQ/ExbB proton channel family protein [Vampirovibrio sp.]
MDFKLLVFTVQHDWAVLLPIIVASVITGSVIVKRLSFFKSQQRELESFVQRLQRELAKQNYDNALALSEQLGGILGRVSQEGIQLLRQHPKDAKAFGSAFDITLALGVRRLEQGLNVLGTVGTVAPYLGLLGTVIRILLTFGEMANTSTGQASQVMFGIGSALIATAFGLGVAIVAVIANNYFRSKVEAFESDFQLLKLVLLSSTDLQSTASSENQAPFAQALHA